MFGTGRTAGVPFRIEFEADLVNVLGGKTYLSGVIRQLG
jgi:hypothetical protein